MHGLTVSHLRKSYGDFVAVEDLSFYVSAGEIFGLIGPNGAGKSTSMMMIIGLLQADAGSVLLDGRPFNRNDPQMRAWFGIVPQQLAVYPNLTAVQNLRFFGGLNGVHGRRLQDRIDFVLNLTGLVANADQTPNTFSGGMARRLNFGIALMHEPKFVVLDEPTVGIDPQSRSNLLAGVRELGRRGVGVLYTSHYMEEVEAICDRIGIIDHGRLLKEGTLGELLNQTGGHLALKVKEFPAELVDKIRRHAEVRRDPERGVNVVIQENGHSAGALENLCSVIQTLKEASIPVLEIETHDSSLETTFLDLTGRKLRD